MTRALILFLSALLLGAPAQADMYQNAGNAEQPTALQNLTNHILTISGGVLQAGTGSETPLYGTGVPTVLDIVKGTDAAPVTTAGQQIRILYRQGVTNDKCFNNKDDTGCNSPLLINAIGSAATTMVTSAATFYARSDGTANGSNAQAINAIADIGGSGIGHSQGAYIQGRSLTSTGKGMGAEISFANNSNADYCALFSLAVGNCTGIWLVSRAAVATKTLGSALHIGRGDANSLWGEGVSINQNSVATTAFNDNSDAQTSVRIGGTHTYAIRTAATAGMVGFGAPLPSARLHLAGDLSRPTWASQGIGLRVDSATFTDTTSSGAVGYSTAVNAFMVPTIAATNPTTYTSTATVFIQGCPVSGTNVSTASCQALVVGGNSYFGDRVQVIGDLVVDGTIRGAGAGAFSGTAPQVVFYGDSLTQGNYGQYVVLSQYNTGFTASSGLVHKDVSTVTSGYGGLNASTGLTYAPEFLYPYYQQRAPLNVALIWLGTNDIALTAATPATTWTRIQTLAAAAKARGYKVCVGTMISRGAPAPGTWDTSITTLNGLITAGWAAAGVNCLVDFASDPNLAPNGSNFSNLTYYSSDLTHLTEAGKQLAAAVAQTALNTYIATFTGPIPGEFNAPGGMTAAALATAGTIAGSLCRDGAGKFIYKAGANCF